MRKFFYGITFVVASAVMFKVADIIGAEVALENFINDHDVHVHSYSIKST